jgi:HEAT repeat protein
MVIYNITNNNRVREKQMKIKKSLFIAILMCLLIPVSLFAQNPTSSPKKEESIEELYLSNPALRIAYEASRSEDRESKLLAVSELNEIIDKGASAKDEKEVATILRNLTAQGTTVLVHENGRLINYFTDVRREACRVLANVKSEEAKKQAVKALMEVLLNDDDPIVKGTAAYSLGTLGLNENEETARAIATALEAQDYIAPNDYFAFSGTIALGKIAKTNNGIFDTTTSRVLVRITQGNYNDDVKAKAWQVIQLLRTYSK